MSQNRLWSLADVLTLHAKNFVALIRAMDGTDALFTGVHPGAPIPDEVREVTLGAQKTIIDRCTEMGLPVSTRIAKTLSEPCRATKTLQDRFTSIRTTILAELDERVFYAPVAEYTKYFQSDALFGRDVFDNFPSAAEDIFEAGNCLALERATACVLHLMRATEVCLSVLASTLGVTKQNDWGAYLKHCQRELDARAKLAGARSPDEQFYAEAAANIERIRVAWRNPTMHVEKTYTQEHANSILLATKDFMSHLASRLKEEP